MEIDRNNTHSTLLGYILWFTLGFMGIHRLYFGKVTGILFFLATTSVFIIRLFNEFFQSLFVLSFLALFYFVCLIMDFFKIPSFQREANLKYESNPYDYNIAWVLLIFLGPLGLHRFYLGKWISGLIWLCTGGLVGFGYFWDFLRLNQIVSSQNLKRDTDSSGK